MTPLPHLSPKNIVRERYLKYYKYCKPEYLIKKLLKWKILNASYMIKNCTSGAKCETRATREKWALPICCNEPISNQVPKGLHYHSWERRIRQTGHFNKTPGDYFHSRLNLQNFQYADNIKYGTTLFHFSCIFYRYDCSGSGHGGLRDRYRRRTKTNCPPYWRDYGNTASVMYFWKLGKSTFMYLLLQNTTEVNIE